MRRFFEREKEMMNGFDFALVDWRLSIGLSRILTKAGLPWAIIDRGPQLHLGYLEVGLGGNYLGKFRRCNGGNPGKLRKRG